MHVLQRTATSGLILAKYFIYSIIHMPWATTGEIVEMLAETLVSNRNKPLKNRESRELDIASTDRGTSVVVLSTALLQAVDNL
jgi:hypothetical protein